MRARKLLRQGAASLQAAQTSNSAPRPTKATPQRRRSARGPLTTRERLLVRHLETCSAPSSLLRLALLRERQGLGNNLELSRKALDPEMQLLLDLMPNTKHRVLVEALSSLRGTAAPQRTSKDSQPPKNGLLSFRDFTGKKAAEEWEVARHASPRHVVIMFRNTLDLVAAERMPLSSGLLDSVVRVLEKIELRFRPEEILRSLNSISGQIQSEQEVRIFPTPGFCTYGVSVASRAGSIVAMRNYILLAHELGYRPSVPEFQSMLEKLAECVSACGPDPIRFGAWQTRDALRVLTGWSSAGTGQKGERRERGLWSFVEEDPDLIGPYIRALGKFGASEAVWQEWELCTSKGEPAVRIVFEEALRSTGDHRWTDVSRLNLQRDAMEQEQSFQGPLSQHLNKLLQVPLDEHVEMLERALASQRLEEKV